MLKELPQSHYLDVFEAVAYKQHITYEEKRENDKFKDEKDFEDHIKILRQPKTHNLGSQEYNQLNEQLNKLKKKC